MVKELSYIEILKKYAKPLHPLPTGLKSGGKLKRKVHAVFFDIYGTLFISRSGDISSSEIYLLSGENEKLKIFNELLDIYCINIDGAEVLKRYYNEIKKVHTRLRSQGIDFPEVEIERVWMDVLNIGCPEYGRQFAIEYESIFNPVWPMPYLKEALSSLNDRGILLGIISNAQFFTPLLFEAFFNAVPEEFGFSEDLIFYSFAYKYAKPSQFLFKEAWKALRKRKIVPANALFVGNDMLNDIYTAHAAGFQTALFAGDRRSLKMREEERRCSSLSPDLIVTDLKNLSDYINGYGE